MCEDRVMKVKNNMRVSRVRTARRAMRLRRAAAPVQTHSQSYSSSDEGTPTPLPVSRVPCNGPEAHCTVPEPPCTQNLMEIAMRTVALLRRNKLLQDKLADLQRETSEFITSVMNNPENVERYGQYKSQLSFKDLQQSINTSAAQQREYFRLSHLKPEPQ